MSDKSRSTTIFIVYAIVIAFFSLQPGSGISLDPYDKVGHFLAYGVFTGLAYRINLSFRRFIYVCVGIIVYGGALEYAQSYVPGRDMSTADLLANAMGVLFAVVLCYKKGSAGRAA
jgi:VanZ family protein